MSDSVQPHRWQPTRLHHPWDSLSKNTGVGCHFLLQYMKVKSESEVGQLCLTPSDPMDCSLPGSSIHGIFQARLLEWVAIAFSENWRYCIQKFENYYRGENNIGLHQYLLVRKWEHLTKDFQKEVSVNSEIIQGSDLLNS